VAVVQAEPGPTVMAGEVDDVNDPFDPFDPVNRGVCAVNRALDEMLLKSFAQFYIAVVPKKYGLPLATWHQI
jgi:ABC-type transporter lipoprotein component MlaA